MAAAIDCQKVHTYLLLFTILLNKSGLYAQTPGCYITTEDDGCADDRTYITSHNCYPDKCCCDCIQGYLACGKEAIHCKEINSCSHDATVVSTDDSTAQSTSITSISRSTSQSTTTTSSPPVKATSPESREVHNFSTQETTVVAFTPESLNESSSNSLAIWIGGGGSVTVIVILIIAACIVKKKLHKNCTKRLGRWVCCKFTKQRQSTSDSNSGEHVSMVDQGRGPILGVPTGLANSNAPNDESTASQVNEGSSLL